jgi:hypothetical protein
MNLQYPLTTLSRSGSFIQNVLATLSMGTPQALSAQLDRLVRVLPQA